MLRVEPARRARSWQRFGRGCSLCFSRLSPIFVALGFWHGLTLHPAMHWGRTAAEPGAKLGLSTAILVALWNYMGWDNASTIAREVENPQRNYPRAMIAAALLTAFTYVLPLAAMAVAGLSPEGFSTGSWAIAGSALGGPLLDWLWLQAASSAAWACSTRS